MRIRELCVTCHATFEYSRRPNARWRRLTCSSECARVYNDCNARARRLMRERAEVIKRLVLGIGYRALLNVRGLLVVPWRLGHEREKHEAVERGAAEAVGEAPEGDREKKETGEAGARVMKLLEFLGLIQENIDFLEALMHYSRIRWSDDVLRSYVNSEIREILKFREEG